MFTLYMLEHLTLSSQTRAASLLKRVKPYLLTLLLPLLFTAIFATAASSALAQTGGSVRTQDESSQATVENLRAFAKLYGYVRYFHPSDEASAVDWERFVIYGVREVEDAPSPEVLKEKLETLFSSIAPTVQLYNASDPPPAPLALLTPADTTGLDLVAWQHRGVGLGNPGPYESARLHRPRNVSRTGVDALLHLFDTAPASPLFGSYPAAGEVVNQPLGLGLAAQIPLALYSRDGHTLRPENAPSPESLESALQAVDPSTLTATNEALHYTDVIIAWTIFQHFYPYFDVVEVDWDAVLTETLRRAGDDRTPEAFLQTLRWMVAQLGDGHGRVQHPLEEEKARPPFLVDEVKDKVVIVAVADAEADEGAGGVTDEGNACFRRGDVVTSLDGVPSERVLDEAEAYISGSPQWKRHRALSEFGLGDRGSQAHLTLRRLDKTLTCTVTRSSTGTLQEARPEPIAELQPGVYYVDLSRAEMAAITAQAPTLAAAKGVVFDLRGYPNSNHEVLRYLTQKPLRSARWEVPEIIYPDGVNLVGYDTPDRWTLPPKAPYFTGKIVFLTDVRVISYAESVMGIVEYYKLGDIVGQPTAGANGNVNPFTLPGDYTIRWTGMRVIKHDGSQHHLIGIRPTVPVERTLEGVREGRDEVLERALDLIEASTSRQ